MTIKRSFYTHKIWNNNIQIECIDKNCQKWWNWCIIIISLWHKLPKRFQMSTNCWHKQGGVCNICIQSYSRLGNILIPCKIAVSKRFWIDGELGNKVEYALLNLECLYNSFRERQIFKISWNAIFVDNW